ncbi:hypothetical protein [Streptomyces sp. NPDC001985]|uniref:hypothetical protein n=1 Tax=Streptomyces sp. NPDC001985 TaxID=3154406 RepID=UPI00331876BF
MVSFARRRTDRGRRWLPVVLAVVCSAAVALGAQGLVSRVTQEPAPQRTEAALPAGMGTQEGEYTLFEPTWTTAHISQKGLNAVQHDTGLVVQYAGPLGRNPGQRSDWIGIYEQGRLEKAHRKDWDWVCPNEHSRCKWFGSAIIPAGDDGLVSGRTYTVAYWTDDASESSGKPAVTVDFVVPW